MPCKIDKVLRAILLPFLIIILLQGEVICQTKDVRGLPFIRNYSSAEYGAGIQNWSMSQGENGVLYIANNIGLITYDGQHWSLNQVKNRTKVRATYIDNQDRIYTGSQGDFGYFDRDKKGELRYTSLADSLESKYRGFDETWNVYSDGQKLYFCTFSEVFIYQNERLYPVDSEYPLEISYFIDNQLITQQWGLGLSSIENNQFQLIPSGEFFQDKRVSGIIKLDKDQWLISTFTNGLYTYDGRTLKEFSIGGNESYTINYLLRLTDGNIAFATQNKGLIITDKYGSIIYQIDKSKGLMDNTVNHLFQDNEDNLWTMLNNGLARIDLKSPFTLIDARHGIYGAGYAAYSNDQNILLGTNNGLFNLNENGAEFIAGTEGQVYSIDEVANRLLIGHHLGAFEFKNGRVTSLSSQKGAWLFREHPKQIGKIIEGTYQGLILHHSDEKYTTENITGFSESSRVMEFDDESLWVTHGYKGAYKLELNEDLSEVISQKLYKSENGFPSDILISVYRIANRLIFTSESGIYEFNEDSDRFEPIHSLNQLLGYESSIVDMEEDELGNIYFLERDKLGVLINEGNFSYKLKTSAFNKIKSLWNDDLGNVTVLDNDNILIGAREGFIHYKPSKDIPQVNEFSILITEIINSGKTDTTLYHSYSNTDTSQTELPIFKFAQNSISFRFAAPHFESDREMVFQYMLKNYDETWSTWSDQNYKEYTNLKEGTYEFMVKAKNIYDLESEPISYSFKIKPPIYRTTFAYCFYVLGSLALLFLGFNFLDKRHRSKTLALEKEKNKEIKEKNDEIADLSKKSETEIIRLKNENLEAEIKMKSQELTSSAMHLIQKNQLLNQIKNTLKNINKDAEKNQLTTQLNRIVKSIDKDLSTTEEWQQFQNNFDDVHGNFITRLKETHPDLTPQELKFSAYIRMNLNTKEMANLLNISVRGVEIGRYRIRKKLNLERKDNLSDYILRF
ncbi:MAG TPA: triple tyrosine motif-containing protein [Roseivirga sp.]